MAGGGQALSLAGLWPRDHSWLPPGQKRNIRHLLYIRHIRIYAYFHQQSWAPRLPASPSTPAGQSSACQTEKPPSTPLPQGLSEQERTSYPPGGARWGARRGGGPAAWASCSPAMHPPDASAMDPG